MALGYDLESKYPPRLPKWSPEHPISLVVPLALLFYWMKDNEASDVPLHFTASYAEPLEPLTVGFELLAETRLERLEH